MTTMLAVPNKLTVEPGDRGEYVRSKFNEFMDDINNHMNNNMYSGNPILSSHRLADKKLFKLVYTNEARPKVREKEGVFTNLIRVYRDVI